LPKAPAKGWIPVQISDPDDRPLEQWREGVRTRMVISAQNGGTQLCVFEQWVAPGNGAPTHWHPVEEVLTVREGEAEVWLGEQRTIVRAGQSVIVPARRMHGFRNAATSTLYVHAILASPTFEQILESTNETIRRWTTAS
jgi:quercetin dioxygenase-like cupin family protein